MAMQRQQLVGTEGHPYQFSEKMSFNSEQSNLISNTGISSSYKYIYILIFDSLIILVRGFYIIFAPSNVFGLAKAFTIRLCHREIWEICGLDWTN